MIALFAQASDPLANLPQGGSLRDVLMAIVVAVVVGAFREWMNARAKAAERARADAEAAGRAEEAAAREREAKISRAIIRGVDAGGEKAVKFVGSLAAKAARKEPITEEDVQAVAEIVRTSIKASAEADGVQEDLRPKVKETRALERAKLEEKLADEEGKGA